MSADSFSQSGYQVRLEWGRRGAADAAARGDILIVVDVLSFSTAVATAVARGGIIHPCAEGEDVAAVAARAGGHAAVARRDVPGRGRFSLSPLTYLDIEPGTRVALAGPNGATCARYGQQVPCLLVGALVNAKAAAQCAMLAAAEFRVPVTILACGERWKTPSEDGPLRMAIEDYLGAGAILSYLRMELSPEARVCEAAFSGLKTELEAVLWDCGSARQLREAGYEGDIRQAARLNLYDCAAVMREGALVKWTRPS